MSPALPPPPFIIGIAGGSGSGKSTVTRRLVEAIGPEHVALLVQDNYYRDQPQLSAAQRSQTNYDHPDAFDWALLREHLAALDQGRPVAMPHYDFATHRRADHSQTVAAAPVIVLEGILALHDAALRERMALKLFVDTDGDIRFIRRLERDIAERGRTLQQVVAQYLATVRPMHQQFVEPTRRFADVILPHGANDPALELVAARVAAARR
ncbi:uridine kinase [Pseudogulbenkiania subflava]|uniref:Uridine kinase n=1 Tax=Pseudogulbenkiania subflava DSM 22618 TaxID=1123014 RepID=A0A1Y6BZ74_9NEIS|nr:uridine kinase [Pseudogulbenkiania subflava]SMF36968.1 uridine kinase [Pseudogulbenkiania subflava DSM 22618]